MYLSCNHNLEVMKNTTYIEKCREFDVVAYILTFTKRVLYLTLRNNRVLLKKGVFYWTSKSAISVGKGVFFFRPKSAKRGCFSNLGTSVVYALVGSRGAGHKRRHTFQHWNFNKIADTLLMTMWIHFFEKSLLWLDKNFFGIYSLRSNWQYVIIYLCSSHIRNSRDLVYGIWQYKVVSIKVIWGENNQQNLGNI